MSTLGERKKNHVYNVFVSYHYVYFISLGDTTITLRLCSGTNKSVFAYFPARCFPSACHISSVEQQSKIHLTTNT